MGKLKFLSHFYFLFLSFLRNNFLQSMEWRVRWDIDRLLTHWEPPLALKQFFPSGICGNDKDGVPGT